MKKKWDFIYDEEISDTAGANFIGVLCNGSDCLFFHALKVDAEDEIETCFIFSSLCELFDHGEAECSYPWTVGNDEILLNCLNNLKDGESSWGDGSPIRTLKFQPFE